MAEGEKNIKRFECTVTTTNQYVIEIDTNKFNKEFMKEFREVFYDYYTIEDHVEHIAKFRARYGGSFIEGYGLPMVDGKVPFMAIMEDVNQDININIVNEDNDIDVDIVEI